MGRRWLPEAAKPARGYATSRAVTRGNLWRLPWSHQAGSIPGEPSPFRRRMASASASGAPAAAEVLRRRRIISSRLYLDDIRAPRHPWSTRRRTTSRSTGSRSSTRLIRRNGATCAASLRTRGSSRATGSSSRWKPRRMICFWRVHSESYLNSLKSSEEVARIVEVPAVALLPNLLVQQKLLYPFRKQVGGSVLSAKLALERGWAINIGGGHHCSAEEGGGFCAYADISLCIHFAFVRLNISRVMIIDLDAHQGNGHEKDFGGDGRVYTLDMYNSGIYPFVAESRFLPQLIVYNAGTDILDGDPLGRLKVSPEGVAIRDEKVFRFAKDQSIPLLMLTSGGYMKSSARVIADSIINLSKKNLIDIGTRCIEIDNGDNYVCLMDVPSV
ncbi:hypothetical protein SEVIR_1G034800v4 [Setaria viridis]|uniref:Histone deacetylase domain-containing protein n=1 Tax=Setaria viridis TaxID=4556 RepID=A0A4U6W6K5_SETVI|nr:hypothetical protein SEVIR_1G034800v2 [Setaria viridis]